MNGLERHAHLRETKHDMLSNQRMNHLEAARRLIRIILVMVKGRVLEEGEILS